MAISPQSTVLWFVQVQVDPGLLENNLGEPIEEFMRPYDLQDPRIHVSVTFGVLSVTLVVSWLSSYVSAPQSQLGKNQDGATSKLDFMTLTPFLDWHQLWIDWHFPFPDCSEWRSIHVHVFPHWYGKRKSGAERSKRKEGAGSLARYGCDYMVLLLVMVIEILEGTLCYRA